MRCGLSCDNKQRQQRQQPQHHQLPPVSGDAGAAVNLVAGPTTCPLTSALRSWTSSQEQAGLGQPLRHDQTGSRRRRRQKRGYRIFHRAAAAAMSTNGNYYSVPFPPAETLQLLECRDGSSESQWQDLEVRVIGHAGVVVWHHNLPTTGSHEEATTAGDSSARAQQQQQQQQRQQRWSHQRKFLGHLKRRRQQTPPAAMTTLTTTTPPSRGRYHAKAAGTNSPTALLTIEATIYHRPRSQQRSPLPLTQRRQPVARKPLVTSSYSNASRPPLLQLPRLPRLQLPPPPLHQTMRLQQLQQRQQQLQQQQQQLRRRQQEQEQQQLLQVRIHQVRQQQHQPSPPKPHILEHQHQHQQQHQQQSQQQGRPYPKSKIPLPLRPVWPPRQQQFVAPRKPPELQPQPPQTPRQQQEDLQIKLLRLMKLQLQDQHPRRPADRGHSSCRSRSLPSYMQPYHSIVQLPAISVTRLPVAVRQLDRPATSQGQQLEPAGAGTISMEKLLTSCPVPTRRRSVLFTGCVS